GSRAANFKRNLSYARAGDKRDSRSNGSNHVGPVDWNDHPVSVLGRQSDFTVAAWGDGCDSVEFRRHGGHRLDDPQVCGFAALEVAGGRHAEVRESVFAGPVDAVAEKRADFLDA